MDFPYNSLMKQTAGVLIVGGGVIGLSIAYALARAGVKATVVDKCDLGQEASWAAAGILPGNNPNRAKTPLGRLRGLAMECFPRWSAELHDLTGQDNGYRRCGGLELRLSETELEARRLRHLEKEEELEGQNCRVLSRAELRDREPTVTDSVPGALYFPDVAQVRSPWHLRALTLACQQLGVTLVSHCPVGEIRCANGRITEVHGPNQAWQPDQVVIAAGAWSDRTLSALRLELGVRPVRGQIVLLRTRRPLLSAILMAGKRYLVPRGDGRILVGSTEEDVGFVNQTTARAVGELIEFAVQVMPALAAAEVERTWAGLRPCTPDHRPFIGRAPEYDNLYIATGHFRSGLQLSAITGILMMQMLLGKSLAVDMSPFAVDRLLHVGKD